MTTTTLTLAAFLLARVEEDEAAAKAAAGAPWIAMQSAPWVQVDPAAIREEKWKYGRLGHVATADHQEYADHIARHDPARVLAQCAAIRAVVELHGGEHVCPSGRGVGCTDYGNEDGYETCPTLRALAAVWAGHPDYRSEWAL